MDNSNEVSFDQDLRNLINKYSQDSLLSSGEIVAVLTFVTHEVIHKTLDISSSYQL